MDQAFRNFYKKLYFSTGFIPTMPLAQSVYPGDFFQIKNGEMIHLGNIYQSFLIEDDDIQFNTALKLAPQAWNFSSGITKPYSGRVKGDTIIDGEFEYSKQLLSFAELGSHAFKSIDAESVQIANWNEIAQQLIIKLTHAYFSFREIYVVTESASALSWSLAIAGNEKAELEIATTTENYGLTDIFGEIASRAIFARDIEYHNQENTGVPCFFKAKKLIVRQEKVNEFISNLISKKEKHQAWAAKFYGYKKYAQFASNSSYSPVNVQASVLDMMQGNLLNPNNALQYFDWADASIDDIEKLFITYEA